APREHAQKVAVRHQFPNHRCVHSARDLIPNAQEFRVSPVRPGHILRYPDSGGRMKGFVAGVVFALIVLASSVVLVSHLGLYPIGADNPPGAIEHRLAAGAMDVYAEKHKPAGENPTAITAANLGDG